MEEEYTILSQFKLTKKPRVPLGFFENFYASIKDEIEANEPFTELNIVKRKKPTLPGGFAKIVISDITDQTQEKSKKRVQIIRMTIIATVTSVAAVLSILFYINQKEITTEISKTETVITNDDEAIETYIAYLDEDEMIDYIIENDISIGNDNDDVYDYLESDIEDIYLDL